MRKLASIQKITGLEPIAGADAIEKAYILGWQLVVKKNEFKPGDLCIYCEIDSRMPEVPTFEFLRPRGMRIKTTRLRGQVSQGIAFPLDLLPAGFPVTEGADCTAVLGITKYEAPMPACLTGAAKGAFPSFIPKTDETRVQVLQHILDKYKGETCYITEKLDGSSATFFINNGEFGVCSRNLELLEANTNSLWQVARALRIEEKLRSLHGNFALQGELFGEGIQGNKLRMHGPHVRFFNIFDISKSAYLGFHSFMATLEQLELEPVPVLTTTYVLDNNIDALVKMATIKSTICPDAWAEGIVIRPVEDKIESYNDLFSYGRVTFKAINPEFLIKYGE
ncbi:RNA ligase, DRB0094 family [Chitinophaga jiangningensis]|uniref:RNA ligase, DRB0094 family n=1 Tax=Chitinophaga jiangningensis TaxID=1419482 RepID=A0A1M7J5K9_9BACT|nr:RNA ligase (ATP) [Chitinophaga jiangningensis]SHM48222.1 RNA ligase, DRB0094 family [Chitinophaga jiangningensis]